MNWKNTLQKKLSQGYIDDFNKVALRLLNERGKISAGEVYDNLPKKLRRIMNPTRVAMYLKRVPGVVFTGKARKGGGDYILEKSIQKARRGSAFLNAVAKRLLTDEWMPVEELHSLSLNLRQENGRLYRDRLGRSALTNSLIKYGLAETTGSKTSKENLIRRKQ